MPGPHEGTYLYPKNPLTRVPRYWTTRTSFDFPVAAYQTDLGSCHSPRYGCGRLRDFVEQYGEPKFGFLH